MRRRLRRQRRVREALLLDLGALVYELHRQGKRAPALLQEKAGELGAVDDEVRGLEEAIGDGDGLEGLLATGIVGSCASCGALLNGGDSFCARCGAAARVRSEDEARTGEDTAEFDAGEEEGELAAEEEARRFQAGEEEDELGAREEQGQPGAGVEAGAEWHADEPRPATPAPDAEGPRA